VDFYRYQEKAYRNTFLLILALLTLLFVIILYTYCILRLIIYIPLIELFVSKACVIQGEEGASCSGFWYPKLFLFISIIITLVTIGTAVLYYLDLIDPSFFLKRMIGGREVRTGHLFKKEEQLLNIVEEMSIASGLPTPQVFILPNEKGINALSFGISSHSGSICVTQGCLEFLSRDELQAVIAHEFSHIRNEDGRLNTYLLAILSGVFVIPIYARIIVESELCKHNKQNLIVFFFYCIGLILTYSSKPSILLITAVQRAISRQREFLADAFAVEITRNGDSLANVLKKIQLHKHSSLVNNSYAQEAAHMFFCCIYGEKQSHLLATHPPLSERIQRISPYQAQLIKTEQRLGGSEEWTQFMEDSKSASFDSANAIHANIQNAHNLIEHIPVEIHDACHSPVSAAYVVISLILDREKESILSKQLSIIEKSSLFERGNALLMFKDIAKLTKEYRLPLIEISIPYIQKLNTQDLKEFKHIVTDLVKADGTISLFDYSLFAILKHCLSKTETKNRYRYSSLKPIMPECRLIFSTIAHVGHTNKEEAESGYAAAAGRILLSSPILTSTFCDLAATAEALEKVSYAIRPLREAVFEACLICINHDKIIKVEEAELLKAISLLIDVPLPLPVHASTSKTKRFYIE
jgi:Zn-dependent protease with chaperone function